METTTADRRRQSRAAVTAGTATTLELETAAEHLTRRIQLSILIYLGIAALLLR